jgi:hypothetical protein
MNNTEILDEISGTEIGDEYSLINRRINVYFDKEKIRYDLSIKKAVNRALSVSDTTFWDFLSVNIIIRRNPRL